MYFTKLIFLLGSLLISSSYAITSTEKTSPSLYQQFRSATPATMQQVLPEELPTTATNYRAAHAVDQGYSWSSVKFSLPTPEFNQLRDELQNKYPFGETASMSEIYVSDETTVKFFAVEEELFVDFYSAKPTGH